VILLDLGGLPHLELFPTQLVFNYTNLPTAVVQQIKSLLSKGAAVQRLAN